MTEVLRIYLLPMADNFIGILSDGCLKVDLATAKCVQFRFDAAVGYSGLLMRNLQPKCSDDTLRSALRWRRESGRDLTCSPVNMTFE